MRYLYQLLKWKCLQARSLFLVSTHCCHRQCIVKKKRRASNAHTWNVICFYNYYCISCSFALSPRYSCDIFILWLFFTKKMLLLLCGLLACCALHILNFFFLDANAFRFLDLIFFVDFFFMFFCTHTVLFFSLCFFFLIRFSKGARINNSWISKAYG